MSKTPKYKPTGLDWCPSIPEHWKIKKLKYNTYIKARVGWHGLKSDEFFYIGDGAYCVTGTDFISNTVDWNTCYKVSFERYDEDPYIQLKEDDLLVTKDGTIGKVALVKNLISKATLNSGVFVVRPQNQDYLNKYLFWVLRSDIMSNFIDYTSRGSTIIHLYQDTFVNMSIPLPSTEYQQKIADYLDTKTAQIDRIIAQKQRLIVLLAEERTALINHAVTKGINPNVELKPSGIDWLGDIPKHWEVKKLKYVANIKTGGTPKIASSSIDFFEGGTINWYTPSDFYDNGVLNDSNRKINDLAIENEQADLYKPSSIYLVCVGATLGKAGISYTEGSANQQINIITCNHSVIPLYVYYYLAGNKNYILSEADYTTLPLLNQTKTKQLLIVVPPTAEEQQQIVDFLDQETKHIDSIIAKAEREVELLNEYKAALINEVVMGKKIVV